MHAAVFGRGPFFVRLIHDGELHDEAGPFDDEADAVEMGERAIDYADDLGVLRARAQ